MQLPVPPENILLSRINETCEVSTVRFNTGAYETRAFNGGEVIGDNSVGGYDWNLSDALRTHADTIDLLCGTDLDAKRNTVKVEPHSDEDEDPVCMGDCLVNCRCWRNTRDPLRDDDHQG